MWRTAWAYERLGATNFDFIVLFLGVCGTIQVPPETAALRPEKILRPAKIFVAGQEEKSYYRFCGYGNYENTRLRLS
jgi:hypothetical protein